MKNCCIIFPFIFFFSCKESGKNTNEFTLTDIALTNVKALANNESGCKDSNGYRQHCIKSDGAQKKNLKTVAVQQSMDGLHQEVVYKNSKRECANSLAVAHSLFNIKKYETYT